MLLLWQLHAAGMFYYSSAPAAERGRGRHVGREPYPIKSRCQLENHLHLMGFHQHERWADKYQTGRRRGADSSILMVRGIAAMESVVISGHGSASTWIRHQRHWAGVHQHRPPELFTLLPITLMRVRPPLPVQ